MTNQPQPQITPDDLAAKWSNLLNNLLNQAFIQIISLEKETEEQRTQIREITEDKINLENELTPLKSEIYSLRHELQKTQNALSSEAAEIAAQGKAVIDGVTTDTEKIDTYEDAETIASFAAANYEKEKAASTEAA